MKKIRVMIVEDSIFFRKLLVSKLSEYEEIEIVGYAINAFDAKNKINELNPDVMTLDIEMPGMNGIEFLKKIIPQTTIRVVLVSSLNLTVFEALSAGAVDFLHKPKINSPNDADDFFNELLRKIKIAYTAKPRSISQSVIKSDSIIPTTTLKQSPKLNSTIIVLGASTGGTEATLEVVKKLPAHTPGIVVVQHMPPGFTKMYAERLNSICNMSVKEAEHGDTVKQGQILIAPGDLQTNIIKIGTLYKVNCFQGEKVSGHCPSVDVLFDSAASTAGKDAIGIIMTGMGSDGAKGLLKMRQRGSFTIGQDEESCVVYGMPKVAKDMGAVTIQAPCNRIADTLQQHLNNR